LRTVQNSTTSTFIFRADVNEHCFYDMTRETASRRLLYKKLTTKLPD